VFSSLSVTTGICKRCAAVATVSHSIPEVT
jgi:hypothetical protein